MRARHWPVQIVVLLVVSGLLTAQSTRPGGPPQQAAPRERTGSIAGQVLAASTGRPLRLAQVRLAWNGPPRVATTDANGLYEFTGLPAGRYTVTAVRSGYVTQGYGQENSFEVGTPIDLANGEQLQRVNFLLARGGVVTGRIVDDSGEGIAQVRVDVLRLEYNATGVSVVPGGGVSQRTDDLGQFRVYGLTPGEYLVRAATSGGDGGGAEFASSSGDTFVVVGGGGPQEVLRENYATTYYPGVQIPASAQALAVDGGQEVAANFSMPIAQFSRVSGTVIDSQGRPYSSGAVAWRPAGPLALPAMQAPLSNGRFSITGLAPGEYVLEFNSTFFKERNNPVELASVALLVDGRDASGLVMVSAPGAVVSGRISFDGGSPPDLSGILVNALRVGSTQRVNTNMTIAADGRFQLHGLGGALVLRPAPIRGAVLKSVTLRGRDITDVPYEFPGGADLSDLDIVMTNRVTSVSGTVRGDGGRLVTDASVVVLPDDLPQGVIADRFVRAIRANREGRFATTGLPPGRYVAAALPSIRPTREWDPRFQALARSVARPFTLSEGQSLTLDLPLSTP